LGHLAVPGRSQCLALREARPDTAVIAESARRSSFALRADASRRSVATARRWTSSRASGSAMASSSQVRRTSACAAVSAGVPAHRSPPGHHAVKLSSRVRGRDHVTGPGQIRAPGPPHPAQASETCTHAQRASPLVMIRTSAMKGPGLRGWGAGVGVAGRYPPACSQICAAAETKHPGPHRRHSASLGQQRVRTRHGPGAGVCWQGWWVAAAGYQASREEQHVI
jgi:hypothetical protein